MSDQLPLFIKTPFFHCNLLSISKTADKSFDLFHSVNKRFIFPLTNVKILWNTAHSRTWTPIDDIVRFIAYTGCRLREALHAEWSDFDLEKGIWFIRHKPNCPTKEGIGWSPKWHKERVVPLFPEAIKLLQSLPRYEDVFGNVLIRNESRGIVDRKLVPAQFVFPKHEVIIKDGIRNERYTRVDDVKKAWTNLKKRAGVMDLQLKDLRTYFNTVLKNHFQFSSKEAGSYIGNSEVINDKHYTPILDSVLLAKMQQNTLGNVVGIHGIN
ncbi:MAG: tyrosine-type recombinase/integrase [SAR324 cluster bacterium]|nr:tyrosine-type recombinase/integrase [SAR324 cluster bacterium]